MAGSESGSASQDGRDEDDEEYEEVDGGNRFLGFMFGNVDNSGDLDVDYLDEDAKEHLAALADKLGPSLTEIDLSVKSPRTPSDAAEQDYDEKAVDAVDYEDIDEDYEGSETRSEEDYLLSKKEYHASQISLASLAKDSLFDDEDYDENDEDEEAKKNHVVLDYKVEDKAISLSGQQDVTVNSLEEKSPEDGKQLGSLGTDDLESDYEYLQEEENVLKGPGDERVCTPLPVLCVEDGAVILRFSEIFGIHEPLKKGEKRDHRYSVFKDKYKSMEISDIVEEDEEVFLKGSGQVFPSYVVQHDISILNDERLGVAKFDVVQEAIRLSVEDEEQRKNSCPSAEPLSMDVTIDLSAGWQSPPCSKFYPLDHQDWEDRILWDNSPAVSDNFVEHCDISESESEELFIEEREQGTGARNRHLESPMEVDEKNHNSFQHSSPIILESFGSGDSSESSEQPFSESICHPQLLRLESELDVGECGHDDGGRHSNNLNLHQSDIQRHFSKLSLQNREMMEGSWLDNILWEPQEASPTCKLILDLQDEQMLFEIPDNRDSKHLRLHAGAMIITQSRLSTEQVGQGFHSGWQFNIANDKFYMNRKISQQLQSNSNKRTAYGLRVHHSAPAIKLQTMKLKLSNKDLANFHRPKALWYPHDIEVAVKEQEKGSMKIIIKSLGGKGSKIHVDSEETISSVKAKASKKLDFKPSETVKLFYLGKELEDDKTLSAQNVQPNSLLHLVRTKIHLLPRAQKIPGENKSLRPPGAFKKKSELSVKDGHIFLMEYCEERPLLLSNVGMGANLCTYYQKSSPSDQTGISLRNGNSSLGHAVILEPTDKSPFLGDIKAGSSQSSLETNMFKAPVFPHKVPSTDYLLVRSAKGKLSIRRIDKIAVVGQQEPLMEVLTPGSKSLQTYITNRLLVYVYREFRAAEKRGLVPWVWADELSAQFPNLTEAILRKKLKECAMWKKDSNGRWFWSKKRDFSIPSEEDLKKLVLPENVCAYESMQAGLYRLKHLGITRLTLPTSISSAMSQLPDEAIALAAASHIERELQITPWNLSSNFVACTSQDRENIERLEITGVGDPSGRGLGFSFVRAAPKAPMSNAAMKKKAAAGRVSSSVTGTDADLRRLSMEAAREVLLKFNVADELITKQTRWHRIAMIRKLSSEQAASGVKVDPTTIGKYARGQRMSFVQLQQQTREKCQEIWERQVQSLSAAEGDENESDSEANSDLDSFIGDLENLLDAEECEAGEGTSEAKHEKRDSVKGLKMRRYPSQAQAAEEIEDEAAEAAELFKLLMDDDEGEQKKKKKVKPTGVQAGLKSKFIDSAAQIKKASKTQANGSLAPKEHIIKDSKEVQTLISKKKTSEKAKATKKDTTSIMSSTTKVKIVGDGLKIFKEKKSSRESFVCGACGQQGHMRTNKHCPKYGEEPEIQVEAIELEKASAKSNSIDPSSKSQKKKTLLKSASKIEIPEGEKSNSVAKVLPVKFVCSNEKLSDKFADGAVQGSDLPMGHDVRPVSSDIEMGNRSVAKFSKIKFSNKNKQEDVQILPTKQSIVIRPPADADKGQTDSHKCSIVIRPPMNTDRDHAETRKRSVVIRPPAEKDKHAHKKIVIKRPKEISDVDQISPDGSTGFEHRKTKKIEELSSFDVHRKQGPVHFAGGSAKRKPRDERQWWEEEENRRKEDRARRLYMEQLRTAKEQERELRRYEEVIRMEREEEERQRANQKKKKKKKPDTSDDYLEDYNARRNDRRMPERDRGAKRQPAVELGRLAVDYTPPTKRRRGGEVGLANILERVVEDLKGRKEVSFLFLKPVTKKEAPDYFDIIKRPMDLSTIRDKVRKLEYKHREEFRHDMWQITYNAHLYNDGRNPGIPPLADQLLELCDYMLKAHDESLAEAEAGIEARD